jgi:hypothetical protein
MLFARYVRTGRKVYMTQTYEYAVRAEVMVPEMTSSSFFRSAIAAMGRPQLATYINKVALNRGTRWGDASTRTGPQKCVPVR